MPIPAAGCPRDTYAGSMVPVEIGLACGNINPTTLTYMPIGAMRGSDVTIEWDTVDGTTANSKGSSRENYATYQSLTISGDGVCRTKDGTLANQTMLWKHVSQPIGGQPIVWIRITYPDITIYAFCILSSMGRATQYDDLATYTWEAQSTGSDFGVVIEDTPLPGTKVFATYALALAAFDTFVDGDAIRVVVDETSGDKSTWYSFGETTDGKTFSFDFVAKTYSIGGLIPSAVRPEPPLILSNPDLLAK